MKVFTGRPLDRCWNNTLISLISKKPNPTIIADFRPISMCTVVYKIVTKVIVNRLKLLLPFIVRLNQTSFASDRKIVDNIVIA